MPKSNESINRELFDLLSTRGYRPTMLDTSGKEIPVPEEAEVFQFNFVKDEVDYGIVTISIDGLHKLVIYFNDKIADSEKETSDNDDVSWYRLLNHLKRFAKNRQLSFQVKNTDHLKHDMAKRDHMKKLDEGYYPMGKNKSYSDAVPQVKIVIEHTRNIVEGEQRYRNVARIFVENADGERFLIPTTKPGIARVYARHIAEGGTPYDDRANHITSLVEDYNKMSGFVRATRNGQFNESAQRLVLEGVGHYTKLRETLSHMAGRRGYTAYFENWTPSLMEDETEETNLNELFVQETLDPRIESVLPILSKLNKKISEMSEVTELAEWADSLLEGGDGGEASEEPPESKEGETAEDGNEAPEDNLDEGILDTVKKVGGKVLDKLGHGSDEDLLKDLQQKAGVRGPNHGKPSMAHSDVEKRVDEVDTGQYDARKSTPKGGTTPEQEKSFREKVRQYGDELEQRQKDKSQGVAEGYDTVTSIVGSSDWNMRGWKIRWGKINQYTGKYKKMYQGIINKDGIHPEKSRSGFPIFAFTPINTGDQEVENKEQGIDVAFFDYRVEVFDPNKNDWVQLNIKSKPADTSKDYNPKESVAEGEFAGDFATGEAGQWSNKGNKANKPATVGDLVGEGQEDLDAILRIINR